MAKKGNCGKSAKKAECNVFKSACSGCQYRPVTQRSQARTLPLHRRETPLPTITASMIADARLKGAGSKAPQAI